MLAYIEPVAKKLAERMHDLDDDEKAIFIRAACQRIWLGADNEPEIELSPPGIEAFLANDGLPDSLDSTPSPPPGSAPSAGSPWVGPGSSNLGCRIVEYVPMLPPAHVLGAFALRW